MVAWGNTTEAAFHAANSKSMWIRVGCNPIFLLAHCCCRTLNASVYDAWVSLSINLYTRDTAVSAKFPLNTYSCCFEVRAQSSRP